ncbi:MAG: hypothetical protein KUL78_03260 [Flavobacterium sp.]|nr:hypothetical protein [Flavobacterium sp.]
MTAKVEKLTDDQLKKEYGRLRKEVLVEMVINQEKIISLLMEPEMKKYEMKLCEDNLLSWYGSSTKNSTTTWNQEKK